MRPVLHSLNTNTLRSSAAIGSWAALVFLMMWIPPDVSSEMEIGLLLLVAFASSVSVLLISRDLSRNQRIFSWRRLCLASISFAIPLGWASVLGTQTSFPWIPMFVVIAVFPVATAWLLLLLSPTIGESQLPTDQLDPTPESGRQEKLSSVVSDSYRRVLVDSVVPDEVSDIEEASDEFDAENISVSPNVTQWLTRSLTEDGDVIKGGVRVDFAAGQRDAIVHISFCPPFHGIPNVTAEDLDGANLEIRVAATFQFGTRLTVRRSSASNNPGTRISSETHRIGFIAIAQPVRKAA